MLYQPVTILNVTSPSFSGTTWVNLVLGSHPNAFTVGPPDRVWSLRTSGWDEACRVHDKDCPFWPGFHKKYDSGRNFYVQLAEASGKGFIVINNPTPAHTAAELRHPDLIVKHIQVVRDGRAITNSYAHHHRVDFFDAVVRYGKKIYDRFPFEPDRNDMLALRHEDLLSKQKDHLQRFRDFVGLDYPEDAFEFWKHDHHITSGNAGTIALLKFFKGLPVPNFRNRAFYEAQYERMKSQPGLTFEDERWKEELGRRERFHFDYYCGEQNGRWGYPEDSFTISERKQFIAEIRREMLPFKWWTLFREAAKLNFFRFSDWACDCFRGFFWASSRSLRRLSWSRRRLVMAAAIWLLTILASWILAYFIFRD